LALETKPTGQVTGSIVQLLPIFYLLCKRHVEFNCEYAAISHCISEKQASGKVTI